MKRLHSMFIFLSCIFLISTTLLTSSKIAGAQLNIDSSMPSYGTVVYSPTPNPTPTPSMVNLIWFQDIEGYEIDAALLASHHIDYVIWTLGTFDGDSTFELWHNQNYFAQAIDTCHSHGIKVLVCQMNCFGFQTPINMANTALREACVNTAVNFVQQYGFDGWTDFCEAWTGDSTADFVAWNRAFATAMHNIGKEFVWGNMCYEGMGLDNISGMYGGYSGADYVIPEFYENQAHPGFFSLLHYCFTVANANTPVVIGLSSGRGLGYTLQDYFDGIDSNFATYPEDLDKYCGISLWGESSFRSPPNPMFMTDADWELWDNW